MSIVLNILTQLGANQTAFIQFGIFIVAISFLTVFVYGPYFKAYDERQKQTKGTDQVAYEAQDEAKRIELVYQSKAREINDKIKNIFDDSKKIGSEKSQEIISKGKATLQDLTDKARTQLETQKHSAQKELISISQDVATEISKKLTGVV